MNVNHTHRGLIISCLSLFLALVMLYCDTYLSVKNVINDSESVSTAEETIVAETKTGPESGEQGYGYFENIVCPRIENGISEWDCIWFGRYWQDIDSNLDGKVTRKDAKTPLKWRVLDIDRNGEAFLLSDNLVDIMGFDEDDVNAVWENSDLRAFLNSIGDYSSEGFLLNAFFPEEITAIAITNVRNEDNPVNGNFGGNDTEDRIFCLSASEAMNKDYGFIENKYVVDETFKYKTENDSSRVAYTTQYTDDKEEYIDDLKTGTAGWWLRTPGDKGTEASHVGRFGYVSAGNGFVSVGRICVRPALRLNLSTSTDFWEYAGTVSGDGLVNEIGHSNVPITDITISSQCVVENKRKKELVPIIIPESASDQQIEWMSSDDSVATVDRRGVVTGIKEGSAVITAKTSEREHEASCDVTVIPTVLRKPVISDSGVSTWDCIWFGEFWQEDTNGDGLCFQKDTEIRDRDTKEEYDKHFYFDQDGKRYSKAEVSEGTYPADQKQPIKWRVLDIDEAGNAFLLSDRILESEVYNSLASEYYSSEHECYVRLNGPLTWETCTLRSSLNGYGKNYNVMNEDYSSEGFLMKAFSDKERKYILPSSVMCKHSVPEIDGKSISDKIFCLSMEEATDPQYGFLGDKTYTPFGYMLGVEPHFSRKAYYTGHAAVRIGEPGLSGGSGGWWLRYPTENGANYVCFDGHIIKGSENLDGGGLVSDTIGVRPAMWVDIYSEASLWSYAGTVSSDGETDEIQKKD